MTPQRIVVVGCSGGGKSTLARAIGARLGLPVVHLDVLFWRPGWVESPREPFRARVAEALAGDRWVVDGSFANSLDLRLPRADLLVEVDLPRWRCILRALRRVVRYHGRNRPDLAPGCPEKFDPAFLRYIWRYRRDTWPKMAAGIAAHGPHVPRVRLAGDRAMAAFVEGLPNNPHAAAMVPELTQ
ncbi:MAG: topology modulation protein [Alphaproteobacteria bacterium]